MGRPGFVGKTRAMHFECADIPGFGGLTGRDLFWVHAFASAESKRLSRAFLEKNFPEQRFHVGVAFDRVVEADIPDYRRKFEVDQGTGT